VKRRRFLPSLLCRPLPRFGPTPICLSPQLRVDWSSFTFGDVFNFSFLCFSWCYCSFFFGLVAWNFEPHPPSLDVGKCDSWVIPTHPGRRLGHFFLFGSVHIPTVPSRRSFLGDKVLPCFSPNCPPFHFFGRRSGAPLTRARFQADGVSAVSPSSPR